MELVKSNYHLKAPVGAVVRVLRTVGRFIYLYHEGVVLKVDKEGYVLQILNPMDPAGNSLSFAQVLKAIKGIEVSWGIIEGSLLEKVFPLEKTDVVVIPTPEEQLQFLRVVEDILSLGTQSVEYEGATLMLTNASVPYSLFGQNCQHISRHLAQGKRVKHTSEETKCLVAAVGATGAVGAATTLFCKSKRSSKVLVAVTVALLVAALLYLAFMNAQVFHVAGVSATAGALASSPSAQVERSACGGPSTARMGRSACGGRLACPEVRS